VRGRIADCLQPIFDFYEHIPTDLPIITVNIPRIVKRGHNFIRLNAFDS